MNEWTEKHTEIVKEYERRKKDGTLREMVLIPRTRTKEEEEEVNKE